MTTSIDNLQTLKIIKSLANYSELSGNKVFSIEWYYLDKSESLPNIYVGCLGYATYSNNILSNVVFYDRSK